MFWQQLVNGISLGSSYAVFAIGYTLIVGVLGVLNMAHGSVFMIGAYVALTLVTRFNVNIFVAILAAMLFGAMIGVILEMLAYRPLRRKSNVDDLAPLISTIGFQIVFDDLVLKIWGPQVHAFPKIFELEGLTLGKVSISSIQIVSIITAIILMFITTYFINKTKTGKAIQATAESTETASLLGINTNVITLVTMMIASALGAAAGVLIGLQFDAISPQMGSQFSFKGLAVIILGGLGNVYGAVAGGFILGIAEVMTVAYGASSYRDAVAFILIIVILLVRPQGLFGKKKGERP